LGLKRGCSNGLIGAIAPDTGGINAELQYPDTLQSFNIWGNTVRLRHVSVPLILKSVQISASEMGILRLVRVICRRMWIVQAGIPVAKYCGTASLLFMRRS